MYRKATTLYITKLVILMLAVSLAPLSGRERLISQTQPEEISIRSTLSDLLAYGTFHNAGLNAAHDLWNASMEKAAAARSLPKANVNFSFFISEVETRVGPQRSKIGIQQNFPWFGTLKLKNRAALEMANASQQAHKSLLLDVVYHIKRLYYELYDTQMETLILSKNNTLLSSLGEISRSRLRTGGGLSDLLKIQVEQEKLEDRLRAVRDSFLPLQSQLNALLNRRNQAPLPSATIPDELSLPLSKEELFAILEQNNPQIQIENSLWQKRETEVKLARQTYYPDISLALDYIITGPSPMTGVPDNGKDPFAVTMQLHIPLIRSGQKAAVAEARALQNAAHSQIRETRNRLHAQCERIYYELTNAEKRITVFEQSILPKAREALQMTTTAYRTGSTDIVHVIDSQRTLLELELSLYQSRTRFAQTLAELEKLVGAPLSSGGYQ